MSGVPKVEVRESVSQLKKLMKEQKTGLRFAQVQTLSAIHPTLISG